MNRYMLLFYANERAGLALPKEQMAAGVAALTAYADALSKAGVLLDGGALGVTANAVTVTTTDGELKVHNGPYAETQEQLGGYMMIKVASMDAAREWAAKCPAATWGHVEIRQVQAA